jgi:CDP-glucose 4,6-dehydratase
MELTGFKGRKILITGHTGFKGSWLTLWLHRLGAVLSGVALDPLNDLDAYRAMQVSVLCNDLRQDICDYSAVHDIFGRVQPEIVFHLAARSLVLESYRDPLNTFGTNIMGTANILEACRQTRSVGALVIITSDKCYENKGTGIAFSETDRLGGSDPYSASKAAAEILTRAYRESFSGDESFPGVATARAGNVIGGGDWAENRIVPDCIRALKEDSPIRLRNPVSVRPFQHVLDPLYGYLLLAGKIMEQKDSFSDAWNFGPAREEGHTVKELADEIIKNWGSGSVITEDNPDAKHEAPYLTLEITKARTLLGWNPVLSFKESVRMTSDWYMAQTKGLDMNRFSIDQIEHYMSIIK